MDLGTGSRGDEYASVKCSWLTSATDFAKGMYRIGLECRDCGSAMRPLQGRARCVHKTLIGSCCGSVSIPITRTEERVEESGSKWSGSGGGRWRQAEANSGGRTTLSLCNTQFVFRRTLRLSLRDSFFDLLVVWLGFELWSRLSMIYDERAREMTVTVNSSHTATHLASCIKSSADMPL